MEPVLRLFERLRRRSNNAPDRSPRECGGAVLKPSADLTAQTADRLLAKRLLHGTLQERGIDLREERRRLLTSAFAGLSGPELADVPERVDTLGDNAGQPAIAGPLQGSSRNVIK